MNVSLTPELETFVHEKVKSGRYLSASEVVRQGLRLLEEREQLYQTKLEKLKQELQIGIDASERGEVIDGEDIFAELEADIQQIEQLQQAS